MNDLEQNCISYFEVSLVVLSNYHKWGFDLRTIIFRKNITIIIYIQIKAIFDSNLVWMSCTIHFHKLQYYLKNCKIKALHNIRMIKEFKGKRQNLLGTLTLVIILYWFSSTNLKGGLKILYNCIFCINRHVNN